MTPTRREVRTYGGGIAAKVGVVSPEDELRRMAAACLLWEPKFYQTGDQQAKRMQELCAQVDPEFLAALAIETRKVHHLRHAPLFLARELARKYQGSLVGDTITEVIERVDEMGEFLALYWHGQAKDKRSALAAQVKRGLRNAFAKFDEYQLAKYDRDDDIKLRDVMFLVRPVPVAGHGYTRTHRKRFVRNGSWDAASKSEREVLYDKIAQRRLNTPETREVLLSRGEKPRDVYLKLLQSHKLGYTALLKNLKTIVDLKIPRAIIEDALVRGAAKARVLPFEYMVAARHAPTLEQAIEIAMLNSLGAQDKLEGRTVLVLDVSGSMTGVPLSAKSELCALDGACALAILMREICEDVTIYLTAGNDYTQVHQTEEIPARRGMALDALVRQRYNHLGGGGIFLSQCMNYVAQQEAGNTVDRVVVFTDEVDCDRKLNPNTAKALGRRTNYIVNVGSQDRALALGGPWVRVTGFSPQVIRWIMADEYVSKTDIRTAKQTSTSKRGRGRSNQNQVGVAVARHVS
jgi:60 kDa SS-A/Ro ribonucleoprotein